MKDEMMKVAWTLILPYGWNFKELLVALKVKV